VGSLSQLVPHLVAGGSYNLKITQKDDGSVHQTETIKRTRSAPVSGSKSDQEGGEAGVHGIYSHLHPDIGVTVGGWIRSRGMVPLGRKSSGFLPPSPFNRAERGTRRSETASHCSFGRCRTVTVECAILALAKYQLRQTL